MAGKTVCWGCGGSLREVPRPIRRSTRCPHCRVDLHVCRMCRHFAPRYHGECDHDRAERVLDKEAANFCTYFRPRPDAHLPPPETGDAERASRALGELFGIEDAGEPAGGSAPDAAAQARRELDSLFGIEPREDEAGDDDEGDDPAAR